MNDFGAEPRAARPPEENAGRFRAVRADALQLCTEPDLIDGVLPEGGLVLIVGPSGCGKIFVAIDLGMAVARGERWAGRGPAFRKIGGSVRYAVDDLDGFVDAARRRTSTSAGSPRHADG